jgi:phage protein U
MDSTVMMALGEYRFSISTAGLQELERNRSWRWWVPEVIGARGSPQYVGPGDGRLRMSGTIYPHFKPQSGGLAQIDAMAKEADRGVPLWLVDGAGKVWGSYAIAELRDSLTVLWPDGRPRKIEFELGLLFCADAPQAAGA